MSRKLQINLLVPCTNRKTASPAAHLRHFSGPADWKARLATAQPRTRADKLYCGTAWARCMEAASSMGAAVWVASAGYGFVRSDERLASYSATFQTGHADSVESNKRPGRISNQEWWESIAGVNWWQRMLDKGPWIIQLSDVYLSVLEPGLAKLIAKCPDQVAVIAPSKRQLPDSLSKCLLPIDTRIEHLIPTTRGDAGATALLWVAQTFSGQDWQLEKIQSKCSKVMAKLPPIRTWSRDRLTDAQVLAYIKREATNMVAPSASSLLRRLRDSGQACEQKRFRTLFLQWNKRGQCA